MDNYCVYSHEKLCGEIFYIGIGSLKRPYDKKRRNKFWNYIVNKHGYNINIIKKDISLKQAIFFEIELIKQYGRRDLNLGTLVNLTNGGEGSEGYKHDNLALQKIVEAKLNISIDTKLRMSNAAKLRGIAPKVIEKMTKSRCKKVLDTTTNIIYFSAKEVSKLFNINYVTLCSNLNGNLKNKTSFIYLKNLVKTKL